LAQRALAPPGWEGRQLPLPASGSGNGAMPVRR